MTLDLTALASLRARLMAAVQEEATAILTVSNERIPVDTSTAHDSGRVVTDEAASTVYVTYGLDTDHNPKSGAASNTYIEHLHEDLAAHHKTGAAKFLQSAADDATAGLAARIGMKAQV